jgi:hypothetical protein
MLRVAQPPGAYETGIAIDPDAILGNALLVHAHLAQAGARAGLAVFGVADTGDAGFSLGTGDVRAGVRVGMYTLAILTDFGTRAVHVHLTHQITRAGADGEDQTNTGDNQCPKKEKSSHSGLF